MRRRFDLTHPSVLLLAGLGFGVATSAANHGETPLAVHLSKLLGNDWAWLTAGLLSALPARTWTTAMRRCLAFLLPAVLGYYVSDLAAGTYAGGDMGVVTDVTAYLVIGSITAAGLSLIVVTIHKGGIRGLLASLAVPTYIAHKAFTTRPLVPHDPAMQRVCGVVGYTAVATLLLIVLWSVWRSTRAGAGDVGRHDPAGPRQGRESGTIIP
ncbi:hypothetical protein KV102_08690 [Mumia sp. zg.B53]|uniref:hypothetical protein n=1 Tax=Mumia sp. zg.B53 TaxID=2855449 RepID=UPI001C6E65EC|nr:hypothetical protein [Mumia sp. zg.B53]MBW9214917.1 hypothetical protein [Mumia sp. zg.B53]